MGNPFNALIRELFGTEGAGAFGDSPNIESITDFKNAIEGENSIFNWYKITSILNYERVRTGAVSPTEIIQKIFYVIAHHIMLILQGSILFIIGLICSYLLFKYIALPLIIPILSTIKSIVCFIMNNIGIPKIAFLPEFMPFKLIYKGIIGLLGLPDFFKCDELAAGPFDIELGSCGNKFGGINTIETGCYGDYATDYTLWAEGSEGKALCRSDFDCQTAPVNKIINQRTEAFKFIAPSIHKGIGYGTAPNKYLECCLNQGECPDYNVVDAQRSLDYEDKSPVLSSVGKKYIEKCPNASVTSCTLIDEEEECNSRHQLTSTEEGKMRCQWDIEEFEKRGNLNEPCDPDNDSYIINAYRSNFPGDQWGPSPDTQFSSPCLATHPKFGWKGFCASQYIDEDGNVKQISENPAWNQNLKENYPDMAPDDPSRNGVCGVKPDIYCDEGESDAIPAATANCAWKLGQRMQEFNWKEDLHGKQLDYYYNSKYGKWVQGYISGASRTWRALSHDGSIVDGWVYKPGFASSISDKQRADPGDGQNNINGCGDNASMVPMRESITSEFLKYKVGRTNGLGFREVKGFNEKYDQCDVCKSKSVDNCNEVPPFSETPPVFGCYKTQNLCVDPEEDPENVCPPEQRLYSLSGNNKCVTNNNPETEVSQENCNQSYVQIGGGKFPCQWKEKEYEPCEAYEPCGDKGSVPDYVFPNILEGYFEKYVANIPVCRYTESRKCDDNDENTCEREVKLKDPDDNNIKICTNTEGESDITNQLMCDTSYIIKDGEKYQCKLTMDKDVNVTNNFKNVTHWQTTKLFFDKEKEFNNSMKPEHHNCLPEIELSAFTFLNEWVIIPLYNIYYSVFDVLRYLKMIFWICIFLLILILYYNIIEGVKHGQKIHPTIKKPWNSVNKVKLVNEIFKYFDTKISKGQIVNFIAHISKNAS